MRFIRRRPARSREPAGDVSIVQEDVFTAALPVGEARLVYADPPYTAEDVHGYGAAPDPERLVRRMLELGAEDAAYVIHAGSPSLHTLLPVVEELAPERAKRYYVGQPKGRLLAWARPQRPEPKARLLAWLKPWRPGLRPNVAFQYMWEPIVVFYGPRYKSRARGLEGADWICALRQKRTLGSHPTMKPTEVVEWLLDRLLAGAEPGRIAIDLYAGTGGAALAAARRGCRAIAVERNDRFCGVIAKRVQSEPLLERRPLLVAVDGQGIPEWPTFGRLEPARRGA